MVFPDRKCSYLGYVFQLDDVNQALIDAMARSPAA